MYWTTKLAIMPILPTLCVCEKLACSFGDEISNRTTSDTNTDENNGGDDDRHVTGNIVETCDDNSDDERTSFLHDTFTRLHSQKSESTDAMQMVPLCHKRFSRTVCDTRKPILPTSF